MEQCDWSSDVCSSDLTANPSSASNTGNEAPRRVAGLRHAHTQAKRPATMAGHTRNRFLRKPRATSSLPRSIRSRDPIFIADPAYIHSSLIFFGSVAIMSLPMKRIRTGIEVVITALTRNQVYPQGYRGFESHPVRQKSTVILIELPCIVFCAKMTE